jgi:hypothetical protein
MRSDLQSAMKADVRLLNIRAFPRLAAYVQLEPELHVLSDCGFYGFCRQELRTSLFGLDAGVPKVPGLERHVFTPATGKLKLILYS